MPEHKRQLIHSEPVREIMGSPPRRLIAWGTTVIFVVFVLFFLGSWFIRYPDVIPAPVEITTTNPPVTLTSRVNGRVLELLYAEGDTADSGDLIAVMESSADFRSILALEKFLMRQNNDYTTRPDSFPQPVNMGELQQAYSSFLLAYTRLFNTRENDNLGARIEALREEIIATGDYITRLKEREKLFAKSIELEIVSFRRDSTLHLKDVIPASDLEKAEQNLIGRKMELQQTGLDIMTETIALSRKKQELQDLTIKRNEEFLQLTSETTALRADLLSGISQWKTRFLLISPVRGGITFNRIWSANLFVTENEPVATVVPENQGDFVGRILLGMQKSGKVKPGMLVNIKLSGFPYLEFGMVRGVVVSRSMVPEGDRYYVELSLPDGLNTLYNKQLPFTQNMKGTAEIMTDNLNLLQKIIDPLRYLLAKNRSLKQSYLPE
jgi:multidrug efflux pump subunit AcrA (membrane-fusion protein)